MKESAIKKTSIATIAVTVLTIVALYIGLPDKFWSPQANDQPGDELASFFDGAVIKWIIPNNPGGGYDEYARLIAPYLEKYTGARVQVRNIPGSGGMRALSELFQSPANGLTIGLINGSGMVTSQLAEIRNADYEISELSFLGRVATDVRVLAVSSRSAYSSFADIMRADQAVRIGATGLGGSTYVDAVIVRDAFDLNMNVIHGFDNSSSMRHAMFRGNIDGIWISWGSAVHEVAAGRMIVVLQGGRTRVASLADVPTVFELAETSSDPLKTHNTLAALQALNDVGRAVAAPPGLSPQRLGFLQGAFRRALNDPQFLGEAASAGRPIAFASGEELRAIITRATVMPDETRKILVQAIRSESK